MNAIAIVTARSGSKGLPDKNVRPLCGKPLMAHSIEAALRSGCFAEVMVSTDSERYADIARTYGASVPFLRSAAASSDTAGTNDALSEVLDGYGRAGRTFDVLCILQPTSPLRTADDIRAAFRLLVDRNADAVVGVCAVDHSPLWCNTLPPDGCMDGFIKPQGARQRQALAPYYRVNGAMYLVRTSAFRRNPFLYRDRCFAYVMPRERSVDIDTEMDFAFAEFMMKHAEAARR